MVMARKNVIKKAVQYFLFLLLLHIYVLHIDSVLEFFWNMNIKPIPEMYPVIYNITEGCYTDTCIIYRVTNWVHENVELNPRAGSMLDLVHYSPEDALKKGGMCRHKTALALSMLRTAGIDYCRFRVMVVIDNGVSSKSHAWFECKTPVGTVIECDPTVGRCWRGGWYGEHRQDGDT